MRKKGIAYRRMILSFSAVFLIPLCLIFLFYSFICEVINEQLRTSNDNLIKTIEGTCDRELEFYHNTLVQISLNKLTADKIGTNDFWSTKNQNSVRTLISDLRGMRTSLQQLSDACYDLFIYFPEDDRLLSAKGNGSFSSDNYIEEYLTKDQNKIALWKNQLHECDKYDILWVNGEKTNGNILLLNYCAAMGSSGKTARVCMLIDVDRMSHHISSDEWDYGYDWIATKDDGTVMKGLRADIQTGDRISVDALKEDGVYEIYTSHSTAIGWTYYLLVPKAVVQSAARMVNVYFGICVILCTVVVSVLIRKVVILNYAPLEELIKTVQAKGGQSTDRVDEYCLLDGKIKELADARNKAEYDSSRNKKSLEQWGLTRLLIKPYRFSHGAKSPLDNFAQAYSTGENIVFVLKAQPNEQNIVTEDQKVFIIGNVFLERLGEVLTAAIVEMDGRQILVCHAENITGNMEQILTIISELQQFIFENFAFKVSVSAGTVYIGADGIHKSYLEAREAEEFLPILDQDYIGFGDIRNVTYCSYPYSQQDEERISSAIHNDNAQLASALIDRVIDNSWSNEKSTPRTRRYLINDIYCTLLKTADEKGCIADIQHLPKDLTIDKSVQEIKEAFAAVAESICAQHSDESISANKALCERVMEYIQENYGNSSLNISQTALHFQMSPTALSTLFKNETGKSLLVAINEIRIRKSIEFLKQGYTVAETAEKVGVSESSTFIRLFKKMMGTTPGKIKDNF